MHEIISLQFGQRANGLTTHFWNTQESYFTYDPNAPPSIIDHDVNFRPGFNAKGEETYTPRTVIYDLKGGFGGLRKWGGLYDQELGLEEGLKANSQDTVWNGKIALQQDPHVPLSDYQRSLESGDVEPKPLTTETVRYWSDYNRVYYHPRSIVQVNDYELNSSLLPFQKYETGEDLFRNIDRVETILDRDLRLWAEECDQLQGFQLFTGSDDAWAGFSSRYLEALRDEFGKLSIWTWGIGEAEGKGSRLMHSLRSLNAAKMVSEVSTLASLYVPMSVPSTPLPQYVRLDRESQWHISALLSTAVESMTVPTRLRADGQRRGHLSNLEAALNVNGKQRLAQLQCTIADPDIPMVMSTETAVTDTRAPHSGNLLSNAEDAFQVADVGLDIDLSSFTTERSLPRQSQMSYNAFGGVECSRSTKSQSFGRLDENKLANSRKRRRFADQSVVERYHAAVPYPILDSFPPIFTIASQGRVNVRTTLFTSPSCLKGLQSLHKNSRLMASLDEREALGNSLGEISEAYKEGWDSESEFDSDD